MLKKHFDGDFTPDQEKEITFKRWPPGYQSGKLGLALNGLKYTEFKVLIGQSTCGNKLSEDKGKLFQTNALKFPLSVFLCTLTDGKKIKRSALTNASKTNLLIVLEAE